MIITILSIIINGIIVAELIWLIQIFMTIDISFLNPIAKFLGYEITAENTRYIVTVAIIAFVVAVSLTGVVDAILRFFCGFRQPLKDENDKLYRLFVNVCQKANKRPEDYRLYIVKEKNLNAYALGHNSIAVTNSMLKACSDEEIKGVLAHELGHLHYGDTIKTRIFLMVSLVGQTILNFFHVIAAILGLLSLIPIPFLNIILRLISWIFRLTAYVYQFLLLLPLSIGAMFGSRQNEYRADKYAYSIGEGIGLQFLLNRLLEDEGEEPDGLLNFLHSTHPATEKRIAKLEAFKKTDLLNNVEEKNMSLLW